MHRSAIIVISMVVLRSRLNIGASLLRCMQTQLLVGLL